MLISQKICLFHENMIMSQNNMIISQKICLCHKKYAYFTKNMLISQKICLFHKNMLMSQNNMLISQTNLLMSQNNMPISQTNMLISQKICLFHKKYAYIAALLLFSSVLPWQVSARRTTSVPTLATISTTGRSSATAIQGTRWTPTGTAAQVSPKGYLYRRQQNKWYPQRCQIVKKNAALCNEI